MVCPGTFEIAAAATASKTSKTSKRSADGDMFPGVRKDARTRVKLTRVLEIYEYS